MINPNLKTIKKDRTLSLWEATSSRQSPIERSQREISDTEVTDVCVVGGRLGWTEHCKMNYWKGVYGYGFRK